MSLEREFLFISVRHSHLILPGILPRSLESTKTTRATSRREGEDGWRWREKLLSREDVTEMAEQRLQNYGTYLNIGEPSRARVEEKFIGAERSGIPLERQRHKLREREGWGTCRSKLQRFNKSIHPRGGVKSLTGREGEGEGEGGRAGRLR